jgi:hypothetical protein
MLVLLIEWIYKYVVEIISRGIMNYAVGMGSGVNIYIPTFIKTG